MLQRTIDMVTMSHQGQNDWTGLPYVTHLIQVMLMLPPDCSDDDRHIALMHDLFEDRPVAFVFYLYIRGYISMNSKLYEDAFAMWNKWRAKKEQPGEIMMLLRTKGVAYLEKLGYSDYVTEGLRLLTRDLWPDFTYRQYVDNIASSGHTGAIWTRLCDSLHNSDPARRARITDEAKRADSEAMSAKRYDPNVDKLCAALSLTPEQAIRRLSLPGMSRL